MKNRIIETSRKNILTATFTFAAVRTSDLTTNSAKADEINKRVYLAKQLRQN
jgi:hypothetical protein